MNGGEVCFADLVVSGVSSMNTWLNATILKMSHTHTHMYRHTYTHARTCIHTRTHMHTHTRAHAYTHTCTRTHTRTDTRVFLQSTNLIDYNITF